MSWSIGGWCESCGRWDDGTALFARGDAHTWRCRDHVPDGYTEAPDHIGI